MITPSETQNTSAESKDTPTLKSKGPVFPGIKAVQVSPVIEPIPEKKGLVVEAQEITDTEIVESPADEKPTGPLPGAVLPKVSTIKPPVMAQEPVTERHVSIPEKLPAKVSTSSIALESGRGVLDYDPRRTVEQMRAAAEVLIESGLTPNNVNTAAQVITIMKMGSELGMSVMTSLQNIHNIQGKPTLGVHAVAAQLKRYGVTFKIVQDFAQVPVYGGEDTVTTIEFVDTGILMAYKKELKNIKDIPKDLWEPYMELLNDLKKQATQTFSYYWTDAAKAGLTIKDNWQKNPRTMLRNRCLTLGARFVKPEALMGYYETSEMAEVFNLQHDVDDEGKVTIIE